MGRILVGDDDQDILDLVEIVLKAVGHTVQATHIVTGIRSLISSDVLLLDVYMPAFDNRSLCKDLKSESGFDIPVLLFSANEINRAALKDCKADGFLAKPFEIDQLRKFVNSALPQKP